MKGYIQIEPALFPTQIQPNEFWEGHTSKRHPLGAVFKEVSPCGVREWVYVEFGANLLKGDLVQLPAHASVDDVDTNAAATTGPDGESYAIQQVLTPASSPSWTVDIYNGCMGFVDDGDGIGQAFRIRKNTADALYLEEALTTALGTSNDSDITFINQGLYKDVIEMTGDLDAPVLGAVQIAITAATTPYGWVLRNGVGYGILETSAADALGILLAPSTTAGELIIVANATDLVVAQLLAPFTTTTTHKECLVKYLL